MHKIQHSNVIKKNSTKVFKSNATCKRILQS
jgi:hypothetical protein